MKPDAGEAKNSQHGNEHKPEKCLKKNGSG
jgi:hypothetical protein